MVKGMPGREAHHTMMHDIGYLREYDACTQCWRLPIVPNGGLTSTLPRIPELIPDSFTASLTIVYHTMQVSIIAALFARIFLWCCGFDRLRPPNPQQAGIGDS